MNHQDDWIERLTGDPSTREPAIEALREMLQRGLSRSVMRFEGAAVSSEDVAQEAVIKILDSLDQFQGRSRFTTWAMTIATRIAVSEFRRKRFRDVSISDFSGEELQGIQPTGNDTQVNHSVERQELINALSDLIDTELTDKQRVALRAHLDGVPVERIAEATGSNRNAVYKLIHDARTRLRDGFAKLGIFAEDVNQVLV